MPIIVVEYALCDSSETEPFYVYIVKKKKNTRQIKPVMYMYAIAAYVE